MPRFWLAVFPVLAFLTSVATAQDDAPEVLFERGQLRRASIVAQKTLDTHPDDAEALRVLSRIRAEEGRFDEATKLAERAVAAAPKDADAHFALAVVSGMRAQRASLIHKPGLARRFKKEAETALKEAERLAPEEHAERRAEIAKKLGQ